MVKKVGPTSNQLEALIEEIENKHKLGNAKWINGKDWQALKAKYTNKEKEDANNTRS